MKIGLFFGSYNPIHIGHLAIANYMVEFTDLDQLWFVVSPQNPFKQKSTLLPDYQRFELVNQAIGDDYKFRASNIEFNLSKPSYTIDTLTYLHDKFPKYEFVLIMGLDNLENFHKWKNHEEILNYHQLYVYPRPNTKENDLINHEKVKIVNAPIMEISSSFIRKSIKEGKDIQYFLPEKVYKYIKEMSFYVK